MKKYIALLTLLLLLPVAFVCAQSSSEARSVLDRTAKVVGRKGGASANFTMSNPNTGSVSGTIAIKGNKYKASTQQAVVWYNGKTQWTYVPANEEVSITSPNKAGQMTMNPYAFLYIYRSGYNLSLKKSGNVYEVHLKATQKKQGIDEAYITINKTTSVPSQIKIKQGQQWTTIKVSNFKAKNLSDQLFSFNAKDYPDAEVIDLR